MGLDATVVTPFGDKPMSYRISIWKGYEKVLGSVRVANRNIDRVELTQSFNPPDIYRCNYVVQANVEGLEEKLKAKAEAYLVKEGFLSRLRSLKKGFISDRRGRLWFCGKTLQRTSDRRGRLWFWFGVILLSISAFLWLVLILGIARNPVNWVSLVIGGAVITVIPLGLGFYCLKRGSRPVRRVVVEETPTVKEFVDFKWKGKELAQVLNSDANLRNRLYLADKVTLENKGVIQLPDVAIKPFRKHQCVRIRQDYFHRDYPSALPSTEAFEAFDRIAQHILSIVGVHARASYCKHCGTLLPTDARFCPSCGKEIN